MKFFPSIANWRSGILQAVTRLPWNILCGLTGAGCAIVSLHFSKNEALVGQCVRLALTVALGMPLFFSLRMLRERNEQLRRRPIEIIALPLLACCFWRHCIFSSPSRHTFGGPRIRAFGSLIANCFCVFVSPLFTRASSLLVW